MVASPEIINGLRGQIRHLEKGYAPSGGSVVAGSCQALDRLLPDGGLRRGSIVEWIQGGIGCGAGTLALDYAWQACSEGQSLVVIDRLHQIYPPALAGWGVDLARVVLVHPRNAREEQWVWDQALRCEAVGAVWGEVERLDGRAFRRLQLAVEASGGVGLLVRPPQAQSQPSWADARLLVQSHSSPQGQHLQVRLLHCRGTAARGEVQLAFDPWNGRLTEVRKRHETRSRSLAAELARATADRRPTGTYGPSRRTS